MVLKILLKTQTWYSFAGKDHSGTALLCVTPLFPNTIPPLLLSSQGLCSCSEKEDTIVHARDENPLSVSPFHPDHEGRDALKGIVFHFFNSFFFF